MAFFCLCGAKAVVGDDARGYKTDTYDVKDLDAELFLAQRDMPHLPVGIVPPEHPMSCMTTGARQFIADDPNVGSNLQPGRYVREHFPHMDIFRCRECGAGFARQ